MKSLPDHITKLLDRGFQAGGRYRLVWSEDRLDWLDGERILKYGKGRNRWILEKYCPPSTYGNPDEWPSILGPYPSEGDWEHSYTFEADGEAVTPTEELVSLLCRAIDRGVMHTRSQRWAAIKEAKEKEEAERKKLFDDLWDDSAPAPGAKIPEHIQMLDSFPQGRLTTADVPQEFQKRGFAQIGTKDASDSSTS